RSSPSGTCPGASACRCGYPGTGAAGRPRPRNWPDRVGVAEAIAILAAGVAAGTVNAVVGSGSLITFPTLLAFGFAPVVANVSNNVGLVPGNFSGAWGYRRELAGQRGRLIRLGVFSAAGSLAGAAALLALPPGAFKLIVPVLILLSCVLVL